MGRVQGINTLNPQTQACQQVYYDYDDGGRLISLRDSDNRMQFGYDLSGRLISVQNNEERLSYQYDANGNRTGLTLPNGESINYLYYGSGHLSAIKYNDSLISEFERNKLHQEVLRSQGMLQTTYGLDPMGRLQQQHTTAQAQANPREEDDLINRRYQYDLTGNLIQTRDKRMATQHYHYDKLGRLTATNQERFAFDPAHNIIEREGNAGDNQAADNLISNRLKDNRLKTYKGVYYEYDELGNLTTRHDRISGEIQSYDYDLNDRLISVHISRPNKETEEWHYRYDLLGRRIEKVRSKNGEFLAQTRTKFVWDGSHLVQEIQYGNGEIKNGEKTDRTFSYIYSHPASHEPLAQICMPSNGNGTSETGTSQINYFHCDQIGVPRELTDEQGNLLWYADYKGWGGIREEHNLKDAHQPFRLQNQYFDKETGLHYNFFRYYDPHIGRFTQQDPIGLAGGMNLYRFASNVQGYIDPLGLSNNWCGFMGYSNEQLQGMAVMAQVQEREKVIGTAVNKEIYENLNAINEFYKNKEFTLSTELGGEVSAALGVSMSDGIAFSKKKGKYLFDSCSYINVCQGVDWGAGGAMSLQFGYSDSALDSGMSHAMCVDGTAAYGGGIGGGFCEDPLTRSRTISLGPAVGAKESVGIKHCVQVSKCKNNP